MNNLIKQRIRLPARYEVLESAVAARDAMLSESGQITFVSSAATLERAVAMGVALHTYAQDVAEARKSLAEPLNAAAKALRALELSHLMPIDVEKARLAALVAPFQLAERRRVKREEDERHREVERLHAKQAQAEAKAQETGRARDADRAERLAQEADALVRSPLPEPAKAIGAAVKRRLCYRVTDIRALYAARPDLCKVEESASAIQSSCVPEMPVPGLELWWEDRAEFRRGVKTPAEIQIQFANSTKPN